MKLDDYIKPYISDSGKKPGVVLTIFTVVRNKGFLAIT